MVRRTESLRYGNLAYHSWYYDPGTGRRVWMFSLPPGDSSGSAGQYLGLQHPVGLHSQSCQGPVGMDKGQRGAGTDL